MVTFWREESRNRETMMKGNQWTIATILSSDKEGLAVFRNTAYDSSMGVCLNALYSTCSEDSVKLTAADLVGVFLQSMWRTKSHQLKVALCSAYSRTVQDFPPHAWNLEYLRSALYQPEPCWPLIECFQVAVTTLGPRLVGGIQGDNKSNESMSLGQERLIQDVEHVDISTYLEGIHSMLFLQNASFKENNPLQDGNYDVDLMLVLLKLPGTHMLLATDNHCTWKTKCLSLQAVSKPGPSVNNEVVLEFLDLGLRDEAEEVRAEAAISMPVMVLWSCLDVSSPVFKRMGYLKRDNEMLKKYLPFSLGLLSCLYGCRRLVSGLHKNECKLVLTGAEDLPDFLRNHFVGLLNRIEKKMLHSDDFVLRKQALNRIEMLIRMMGSVPKLVVLLLHAIDKESLQMEGLSVLHFFIKHMGKASPSSIKRIISQVFASLLPFLERDKETPSIHLDKVAKVLEELVFRNKVILKQHICEFPALPSIPALTEVMKAIEDACATMTLNIVDGLNHDNLNVRYMVACELRKLLNLRWKDVTALITAEAVSDLDDLSSLITPLLRGCAEESRNTVGQRLKLVCADGVGSLGAVDPAKLKVFSYQHFKIQCYHDDLVFELIHKHLARAFRSAPVTVIQDSAALAIQELLKFAGYEASLDELLFYASNKDLKNVHLKIFSTLEGTVYVAESVAATKTKQAKRRFRMYDDEDDLVYDCMKQTSARRASMTLSKASKVTLSKASKVNKQKHGSEARKREPKTKKKPRSQRPPCKKALLIGILYHNNSDPDERLKFSLKSIEMLSTILCLFYDFYQRNIKMLCDVDGRDTYKMPTRENIRDEVNMLLGTSQAGDVLFIYVSAHGRDGIEDNNGEAYFLSSEWEAVSGLWEEATQKIPFGVTLTICLDCCKAAAQCNAAFDKQAPDKGQVIFIAVNDKHNKGFDGLFYDMILVGEGTPFKSSKGKTLKQVEKIWHKAAKDNNYVFELEEEGDAHRRYVPTEKHKLPNLQVLTQPNAKLTKFLESSLDC